MKRINPCPNCRIAHVFGACPPGARRMTAVRVIRDIMRINASNF